MVITMQTNVGKIILFMALILWMCSGCTRQDNVQVTISVTAAQMPPNSKVCIAGNLQEWHRWRFPHAPLTLQADSSWRTSLSVDKGTLIQLKFTRGDWRTEAVDSQAVELPNFSHIAIKDTVLNFHVPQWRDQVGEKLLISIKRMENKGDILELWENWRFCPGDDSTWAEPAFNDDEWQTMGSRFNAGEIPEKWQGIGWFRLHATVDSSVVLLPLAWYFNQIGAAEIYLDGKRIAAIGKVGNSPQQEREVIEQNPLPILFTQAGEHLFAVRYSAQNWKSRFFPVQLLGFEMHLNKLDDAISGRVAQVRSDSINQLVFSIIPLSFAVIHLLLFVFYPQFANNLFYALSMLGFSVLAFTAFAEPFFTSRQQAVLLMILNVTSINVAIAFGMLSVYATIYKKMPLYTYFPMISLALITLMFFLIPQTQKYFPMIMYTLLALSIIDIGRLTLRSSRTPKEWGWIIGAGFTLSLLVFAYQFLMNAGLVPAIGANREVWMYGIPILAVSLSIYISLNFAQTHQQLTAQLARVKKLSDEALTQERRAKEEEIRRLLLQADNQRKTEELEEARRLQLSMLPKQVPLLDHLDIAVSMQTATEVGGDYYDFFPDGREHLLFAIGDATGHGIKAGTMVASTKALFNSFHNDENLAEVLTRWSTILHNMNLGNLYMSLSLVRVNGRTITLANAGMPPALHYHAASGQIEEVVQKSMPLGSSLRFPYTTTVFEAESGDVLLFMSDGLPELFNQQKEEFELERVKTALQRVCAHSAQQIIRSLNAACAEWQNTAHQNDDITLIAVKFL